MDLKQIEQLMEAMRRHGMGRLSLKKKNEYELDLEKEGHSPIHAGSHAQVAAAPPLPAAAPHRAHEAPAEGRFVTSPMVGTFYATPAPEEPPFVRVGDTVEEGTVVFIIEAMKVMNEVKAGVKGKVAEVLLKSGDPVEFGTKIIKIV